MNASDGKTLDMLGNVVDYGGVYKSKFTPLELAMFAAVGAAHIEMRGHMTAHVSIGGTVRQQADRKAIGRVELHEEMDAVARTARSLAVTIQGLEEKFRMPRGGGDNALIATARAFAQDAVELESEFIRYRMPADFLASLNRRIDEFERAVRNYSSGKRSRAAAGTSIDSAMEKGFLALQQLDGIIANIAADDPAMKTAWDNARRIARPAGRGKAAAASTAIPPTT